MHKLRRTIKRNRVERKKITNPGENEWLSKMNEGERKKGRVEIYESKETRDGGRMNKMQQPASV